MADSASEYVEPGEVVHLFLRMCRKTKATITRRMMVTVPAHIMIPSVNVVKAVLAN